MSLPSNRRPNAIFRPLHLIILLSSLVGFNCVAETRYVTDELQVNLRSGQGNQFRILKLLPSGTQLELIEIGDEGTWALVETTGGEQGWVRNQYLDNEPIAQQKLLDAQRTISRLTTQQQELSARATELEQQNATLSNDLNAATSQAAQLQAELDNIKQISSNALDINQRHQSLMEEHQALQTRLDVAVAENERLNNDARQTWFLYGALAVVIGVLLTLLVQKLRTRRRYSEWA